MTGAIFCPICRGVILAEFTPMKPGYSRLETTCTFCGHHVMIHDFGRCKL